jgi:hypothetical protein
MQCTVFSPRYPPVNRRDTGLSVLQIEMVDGLGILTVDPNRAALIGHTRQLPLSQPKFPSVLTGRPGYLYRTGDGVELALAEDELLRLLRHALRPDEVRRLHELFGAFFETHGDFYDEVSGAALQPMG